MDITRRMALSQRIAAIVGCVGPPNGVGFVGPRGVCGDCLSDWRWLQMPMVIKPMVFDSDDDDNDNDNDDDDDNDDTTTTTTTTTTAKCA